MSDGPPSRATRLERRSRLPEALVRGAMRHARPVLGLWLLACLIATPGALRLDIETSTDSLLDTQSPQWSFYQEAQRIFGGDEILVVLLRSDAAYDPEVLARVVELSDRFRKLPGVRRVDSLSTVPLVESTPEADLSLEPALAGGIPETAEARSALAKRIAADRVAPRGLVSEDGHAFAVNLVLQSGAESSYEAILAAVDASALESAPLRSGVPVFRVETSARTRTELGVFVPLCILIVGLLFVIVFRAAQAGVIALGVSGTAVWIVLGVMGYLETPLTVSTVILPPVLLALGSAYCMHFLTVAEKGGDPDEIRSGLRRVALPVALSGLTTAIGFTAVSFVPIQAVRDVSAYGALGVLLLVAASLSAAPAALQIWPLPQRPRRFEGWLGETAPSRLVAFVAGHGARLLLVWALLLGFALAGIGRLHVETDAVLLFPESDPIRVAYDEIRSALSGISPMNVVIDAGAGHSIAERETLAAIDALEAHMSGLPDVGKALSISDPLRQLHGGFADDPSQPLPDDEAQVEQYLLLLEAKPYIFDLVSPDHRWANLLLRVDNNGSSALLEVAREAERWWASNGPAHTRARTTGIMHEYARSEDRITEGQIRGLAFAVVAIGVIMLGIFTDLRLAALALIPNAVPVAIAFGSMGWLGIPIDAGTVFVGNLALGIAVDDTIHELAEFQRRRIRGEKPPEALRGAFGRVLRPLVLTTLVVASGFAVLGVSDFTYTRNLGLLTSSVMIFCLLADLLLLPVLLLRWSGNGVAVARHPGG